MEYSNKKIQWAWTMYDWANSVHSLTIATALFPIYWKKITGGDDGIVQFLGMDFKSSALYAYCLAFAFLFIALLNPLLSGIADTKGNKKTFMKFFVMLGGISCLGMYFFYDENTIPIGIATFIISMIGYAGSLVFYNAYLPEIAQKDEYDKLSAKGFAMGYIGCVILLILNLLITMKYEWFGLQSAGQGMRISFASVGIWWMAFSLIPFKYLPDNKNKNNIKIKFFDGYKQTLKIGKQVIKNKAILLFLSAFFFYAMGTQTTMYLASMFGSDELMLEDSFLIITVLVIQLVAIVGAMAFAKLAEKIGGISTLMLIIPVWIVVCVLAYFTYTNWQFLGVAFLVGLVMGGVQSMSRSTFTKFLPKQGEHASYYSFYELTEKIAIVLGTFSYGLIDEITGGMRPSIVALAIYFIIGFIILAILRRAIKNGVTMEAL